MRSLRRYAVLLRLPGARRAVLPALLARSTYATAGLALVLLIHQRTGSFATAGLVVACYSLAAGVSSPLLGRAVDRPRGWVVLAVAAAVFPALLLTQLVVPAHGIAPLFAAAAAGLAQPPTGPAMRALWPDLTADPELVASAYNFESVVVELVFVAGPLLVGTLAATVGPGVALAAAGVAMSVGTLGFATAPAVRRRTGHPAPPAGQRRERPLGSPGVRTILATIAVLAAAFGVMEVTVPAFAAAHGSAARSGWVLSGWAAGSLLGGLWYGGRRFRASPVRRYLRLLPLIGLTMLPLAVAPGLAVLGVLMFISGLVIAPTGTEEFALLGAHAPPGARTETFSLSGTLIAVGGGAGNALAGQLVARAGTSAAFTAAALLALAAFGVAYRWRRHLPPPPRPRPHSQPSARQPAGRAGGSRREIRSTGCAATAAGTPPRSRRRRADRSR